MILRCTLLLLVLVLMTACADDDLGNHRVGGTVTGLAGTLVLQNNTTDTLTVVSDGAFVFGEKVAALHTYSVRIVTQPENQTCVVRDGDGLLGDANVTTITVSCENVVPAVTYHVSANVSGLSGTVVLRLNGDETLDVTQDGAVSFQSSLADGAAYEVTVATQPATQFCSVTNGKGSIAAANVSTVQVTCAFNTYGVGGSISGLIGTVVLTNNGGDALSLTSNGQFTFVSPVASNGSYNVEVLTQPSSVSCNVTNNSGPIDAANVTNVAVICTLNPTTITASVSSLTLSVTGRTETGVAGTPSSGVARALTVTNTGTAVAINVQANASGLPAGTTISSSTCSGTLAPGASCAMTVTPGATASSDGTNPCSTGTSPVSATLDISGDNTSSVSVAVVVLDYNCIYAGGYVYALDDTTPSATSVGGHVVATSTQGSSHWTNNIAPIYGIDDSSTPASPSPSTGQISGQTACTGQQDGACNTNNIYIYSQSIPVATSTYAAGFCRATIASYSDWYLPARCQLANCGTTQSVRSSLGTGLFTAGETWTSTQFTTTNGDVAYLVMPNGVSSAAGKAGNYRVRCGRDF